MRNAGRIDQRVGAEPGRLGDERVALPTPGRETEVVRLPVGRQRAAVEIDPQGGFAELRVPVQLMLGLQDLSRKNHAEKTREPRGQTSRGWIGRGAARFGVGRALPPARHVVRLQWRLLLVARHRGIEMDAAVRVQPDAVEVARDRIGHRHGLRPRNARNRAARVIVGAAAAIGRVRKLEVDEPGERAAVMRGMDFDPHAIAGLQRRLRPALARQHVDRPVLDLPNGLPAVRGGNLEEHPRVRVGPAEFLNDALERARVLRVEDRERVMRACRRSGGEQQDRNDKARAGS